MVAGGANPATAAVLAYASVTLLVAGVDVSLSLALVSPVAEGLGDSTSRGRPIVEAVVGMAQSFGLRVVAEGVEEPLQAIRLVELGIEVAQGWLWSPAVPADEASAMVRADSPPSPTGSRGRHDAEFPAA